MDNRIRYTLGKEDRLKSRKAIEQLFREGSSFTVFPFRVLYMLNRYQPLKEGKSPPKPVGLQAGFSVSSRNFKKAVERNRIKRLMREAYRLQKNDLQQLPALKNDSLAIFFIYIGKKLPEYAVMYEKSGAILKRLIRITGEPS